MQRSTRVFARRQSNWFKESDPTIIWYDATLPDLVEAISALVQRTHSEGISRPGRCQSMSRHPPFQYAAVPANRPWLSHYDVGVPPAIKYSSQTVQDLLAASARRFPDRACTLMGNQVWSYAEVETGALALARALVSLGVKKGDRIGILMPNIPQFVLGFYGIVTAGAVVVALNPLGTSSEHFHQLHDSGIGILLVSSDQYPKIAGGSDGGDLFRAIVATPNDRPSPQSGTASAKSRTLRPSLNLRKRDLWLADVLASPGTGSGTMPVVDAHDTALFQYSGGTTGTSKAAVATHAGVVANTIQFRHWLVGLQEGREVMLMAIPLYHAYGMIAGMSLGIALGREPGPGSESARHRCLARHDPRTSANALPGRSRPVQCHGNHPDVTAGRVDLASIRVCISGSTALLRETKERFESLSGGQDLRRLRPFRGAVVTHCNPLLGANKIGSIGMPMPDVDCRIVDAETTEGSAT